MASPPPKKFTTKNGVHMLNPEYLAWKQHKGKTVSQLPTTKQQPSQPIDKMVVQIMVIEGKDLVAKDRNLFGKKTTSDPYVSVALLSSSPRTPTQKQKNIVRLDLGKTATVKKSLSPTWNHSVTTAIPYNKKDSNNTLVFQIFDEDKLSSDDSMGVVKFDLIFQDHLAASNWYQIPTSSAKGATGQLKISIQTSLHRVQGLAPYC